MSAQENLDPVQQRYKYFCEQNPDEGHFDVIFQFGDSRDAEGNIVSDDNVPVQLLYAHSFTLWPSSKVFEKTLFGPLAHKGPIPIIRHSYNDFKDFLTFMYLGKCDIRMDNVMALVDLGEYYETKLLKDKCDKFLTQNSTKIENVLKVYESLKVYSLENAMAKVMEFVAENTVEILKSDEFLSIKKETILDILKMKNLKAKQEDVFEAICKWAEHNCPEDTVNKNEFLKQQLQDVIPLIDFSEMDFNFLNNFVVRKGFLFPSYDVLADALCEAATKKQRAKEERLKIVPKRRRVQFTSGNGYKAYADICDPTVISAIETMIANNSSPHLKFAQGGVCQWNANIGHPQNSLNAKFCLIRDASGYLSLKAANNTISIPDPICCKNNSGGYNRAIYGGYGGYGGNGECEGCITNRQSIQSIQQIKNDNIIAPVFVPNGSNFYLDHQCKIEFI